MPVDASDVCWPVAAMADRAAWDCATDMRTRKWGLRWIWLVYACFLFGCWSVCGSYAWLVVLVFCLCGCHCLVCGWLSMRRVTLWAASFSNSRVETPSAHTWPAFPTRNGFRGC